MSLFEMFWFLERLVCTAFQGGVLNFSQLDVNTYWVAIFYFLSTICWFTLCIQGLGIYCFVFASSYHGNFKKAINCSIHRLSVCLSLEMFYILQAFNCVCQKHCIFYNENCQNQLRNEICFTLYHQDRLVHLLTSILYFWENC